MSYGMFTEKGNGVVGCVVQMVVEYDLTDWAVMDTLAALAKDERYREATDTDVREAVFKAINEACSARAKQVKKLYVRPGYSPRS